MRSKYFSPHIIILFLLAVDIYSYQAVKTLCRGIKRPYRLAIEVAFWCSTVFALFLFFGSLFNFIDQASITTIYLSGICFIIYASKLAIIGFLWLSDMVRLYKLLQQKLFSKSSDTLPGNKITRSKFLQQTGVISGGVMLSTLTFGMLKWVYDFTVNEVTIHLPDLPESFDGFRILQISDLHVGGWLSKSPVQKAVDLIKAQETDIIIFTGDLINYRTSETKGYHNILSQLDAPMGVYSILGNHDYGDYILWDRVGRKQKNFEALIDFEKGLGWNLLMNENTVLQRGTDKIALIGSENWSSHKNFNRYGNMELAYAGVEDIPCKLLMTHDPTHWDAEIIKNYKDIDVTFCGHTHGTQIGVNIPGFQFSPASLYYKHWMGLYAEENEIKKQYLYVNSGLGFIAYPGRVGILPEISVFTLRKA